MLTFALIFFQLTSRAPACAKVPFLHGVHSCRPVSLWKDPAWHATHTVCPVPEVNWPGPHARQALVASSTPKKPRGHWRQAVCAWTGVYLPGVQDVHIVLGEADEKDPAAHA